MQLLEYMFHKVSVLRKERGYTFRLQPLRECPLYLSHFPGSPVTPGVCLVQVAEELLSEVLQQSLHLAEAENVKFLQVLVPTADKEVEYHVLYDPDTRKASVVVSDDATTYAKMTLRYARHKTIH